MKNATELRVFFLKKSSKSPARSMPRAVPAVAKRRRCVEDAEDARRGAEPTGSKQRSSERSNPIPLELGFRKCTIKYPKNSMTTRIRTFEYLETCERRKAKSRLGRWSRKKYRRFTCCADTRASGTGHRRWVSCTSEGGGSIVSFGSFRR